MEWQICTMRSILATVAWSFVIGGSLVGFFTGCSANGDVPIDQGWPKQLVIGYNAPEEETERRERDERYAKLEKYLERTLEVDVKIVHSGSYSASIEAMRAKKIDICEFGAFSYILAGKLANAEPLVVRGSQATGPNMYRSLMLTSADSKLTSLEDVLANAGDLKLAFTDPTSTSGHLVPRGYLDTLGIKPEDKFKEVIYSNGHSASVLTTIAGKVDVACVASAALDHMEEKGLVSKSQVRVLWESPPMPREPVSIRGDLPSDFKAAVQKAYLTMSENDPETFALVSGMSQTPDAVFLPGDDSLYDYYREIARGIETMKLLD